MERVTKGIPQFRSALMCAEKDPLECHRRLVVEYLQRHWGNLDIKHIV